jgi:hypothetical protein
MAREAAMPFWNNKPARIGTAAWIICFQNCPMTTTTTLDSNRMTKPTMMTGIWMMF